jgi:hypothetical protein
VTDIEKMAKKFSDDRRPHGEIDSYTIEQLR